MAISASIFEAKTNLSQLLEQARQGEEVIITSGRAKTPVARIEPLAAPAKSRLGVLLTPGFALPESFFDLLSEEELAGWEGDGQ